MNILVLLLSFTIGSIPFGLLIGKLFYGIDVRELGSKSIGATNVYRTLGAKAGIATFVLDFLKGAIIVYILKLSGFSIEIQSLAGYLALFGHCFSLFLKFKGGKGVATGFAVFMILAPNQALLSLLTFILIFAFSGIISISSIGASLGLYLFILSSFMDSSISTASLLTFLTILIRHKENIKRLLSGTENRFKSFGI